MSLVDAMAYIDKAVDNVEDVECTWRNDEVMEMLRELRALLSAEAEAMLHRELAVDVASALYQASIAHLQRQVASARRWAVQLEQELVDANTDHAAPLGEPVPPTHELRRDPFTGQVGAVPRYQGLGRGAL